MHQRNDFGQVNLRDFFIEYLLQVGWGGGGVDKNVGIWTNILEYADSKINNILTRDAL